MPTNHYELLGISPSASLDKVRRAYKTKALSTHPDKLLPGASSEEKQSAEARFHAVYNAFETLIDPTSRRAYDYSISHTAASQARAATLAEQQARRKRERDEWARSAEQQHRERMRQNKQRREEEAMEEALLKRMREMKDHQERVAELFNEFRQHHPEWEERRLRAQQFRADQAGRAS